MLHPFQCLASSRDLGSRNYIFLACGSQIHLFDSSRDKVLSTWPANSHESKSAVTKLLPAKDGHHLVATTAEDKAILVFSIENDNELRLLSRRYMPKRPCAIAFSPAETQILCADKFGDVYSLPLIYDPTAKSNGSAQVAPKPYRPAANSFTVHTERNLKTLQMQLNSKNQTPKTPEIQNFERDLVMGHVSMLTDLISITRLESPKDDTGAPKVQRERPYIITADRDEHIRISRGLPQAHIIHNYCFGHTEFVNKICSPFPDILVSGGGDDEVFVWNWYSGALLGKVDVLGAIQRLANDKVGAPNSIAVSGLWSFSAPSTNHSTQVTKVVCICEGIPALITFPLGPDAFVEDANENIEAIGLQGNPVDVCQMGSKILVTLDSIHVAGSKSEVRKIESPAPRLYVLDLGQSIPVPMNSLEGQAVMPEVESEGELKALRDLLYGVENLRKRGNEEV